MVYAPGHFQRLSQPRRPSGRERWVVASGAVLTALVIAVTLFSLTASDPRNGHGCLGFTYSMAMGGEQLHACGARARRLCARPPRLGGLGHDFAVQLRSACLDQRLPYDTARAQPATA